MLRKISILFFGFFWVILISSEAFASNLNLPTTAINPDKYLFFSIKRLVEKAVLYSKFTQESKADYYKDLILKRAAELRYVVDNEILGEIERSSQRISSEVGTLSDYVNVNKVKLGKEKKPVSELLESLKPLLGELRDHYPSNSSYWLLLQHSINSIDLNLEKLK